MKKLLITILSCGIAAFAVAANIAGGNPGATVASSASQAVQAPAANCSGDARFAAYVDQTCQTQELGTSQTQCLLKCEQKNRSKQFCEMSCKHL
jgi:hypothetical protein